MGCLGEALSCFLPLGLVEYFWVKPFAIGGVGRGAGGDRRGDEEGAQRGVHEVEKIISEQKQILQRFQTVQISHSLQSLEKTNGGQLCIDVSACQGLYSHTC